jgi:hypothetical protein
MKAQPVCRNVLQSLLKSPAGDYASIYLASESVAHVMLEGPIEVKNAAAGIETRLTERGWRSVDARAFAAPLRTLAEDDAFWKVQRPGVGLFLSQQGLQAYRLRGAPRNNWWLGDRYRVLPLLSPCEEDVSFHLLAVSANKVSFYEGSNDGLQAVEVDELPKNVNETVRMGESTALVQVVTTPTGTTFHGQGPDVDHRKQELREYCRRIVRALHPHLGESSKPLIFAGVDPLFPIFREMCTYSHLLDTPLAGNPDRMGAEEFRLKALELLRPLRLLDVKRDLSRYEDSAGSRRTTERLSAVLGDAHRGMVEALFVADGGTVWGRFDSLTDSLALTSAEDSIGCDLYDLAASQTLLHGGRVHVVPAVEVPHAGTIAALLRYAHPMPV